jgi:hypothetical protein
METIHSFSLSLYELDFWSPFGFEQMCLMGTQSVSNLERIVELECCLLRVHPAFHFVSLLPKDKPSHQQSDFTMGRTMADKQQCLTGNLAVREHDFGTHQPPSTYLLDNLFARYFVPGFGTIIVP